MATGRNCYHFIFCRMFQKLETSHTFPMWILWIFKQPWSVCFQNWIHLMAWLYSWSITNRGEGGRAEEVIRPNATMIKKFIMGELHRRAILIKLAFMVRLSLCLCLCFAVQSLKRENVCKSNARNVEGSLLKLIVIFVLWSPWRNCPVLHKHAAKDAN